ncbi:unnamed protein product, partial [Mesorhabditis belari]|uniref:Uncharacterized protein n=1 Tax=Mesorhabditis belari TaxID=2138241 RepID=A0AAF3F7K1_9BILA
MNATSSEYVEEIKENGNNSDCFYDPPFVTERFWLVGVAGTTVAIISFIENAFLFYVLMKSAYIPLMSLESFR